MFGACRWHNFQTTKKVGIFQLNNSQNILHYNLHCVVHWLYYMYVLVMLLLYSYKLDVKLDSFDGLFLSL